MNYGIGPRYNAPTSQATMAPIASFPAYNNIPSATDTAEMERCKRVKGGRCQCNGKFAKKSRCR